MGGVALLVGGWLLTARPWSNPPPVTAEHLAASLELAAGEVRLLGEDGTQDSRLVSGAPLPDAARLQTGAGARALVRLSDGSRIFLDGDTTVEIDAGMKLVSGRLWLDAPPLEREQDPTTHHVGDVSFTLADGGASIEVGQEASSVYVAEGLAVLSASDGRSEVEAGEQATLGEGAPKVAPVAFWNDWTGGMGDRGAAGRSGGSGSGSLYAVDRAAPAGTPALPLSIQRQGVQITLRDSVAETVVDQTFFNPSGRVVEGYYWFTVPSGAQLVSFALETNGQLVEGEIVERSEARSTYEAAVRRDNDPALLEWIDERTVRARIYPVPALGARRTVLRYQQVLSETEGKLRYSYPLAGDGGDAPAIEEFSLAVDLGDYGKSHHLATLAEARVEGEGRRVTMRRSGYVPRANFELELSRKDGKPAEPLRLNVVDPGGDQASYVMVRWVPDLDFDAAKAPSGDVVVVVDTSAAGDASEHHTKLAVAEALLHSLSEGDRFAVMSADLTATVLYPDEGLASADKDNIASAMEKASGHGTGGATDLAAIFDQALARVHGLEQPAIVYVGDGIVTSGERGGEQLAARLRRSMVGSRARLFTVGVGAEIDHATLGRLARVGGGDFLRVDDAEQAVVRALQLSGALKTPTVTDLDLDLGEGLDDVFTNAAGKLSRGQELVLLARTHHDLPDAVTVRGRLGGEDFEKRYPLRRDRTVVTQLVPRLWAAAYADRLLGDSRGPEAVRGKILSLGLEYGFMTPYTSFLALDSEQAYARSGIGRRQRRFGPVQLASARRTADSSVLAGVAGVLLAPMGCGMGSAPEREMANADARRDMPAAGEKTEQAKTAGSPAPPPGAVPAPASAPSAEGDAAPEPELKRESRARRPNMRSSGRGGSGGLGISADGLAGGPEDASELEEEAPVVAAGAPSAPKGGAPAGKLAKRARKPRPKRLVLTSPVARDRKEPCSDGSSRSLAHRKVLWAKRLRRAESMVERLEAYEAAAASCEIKGWRDQRIFLQMLQQAAATEAEVELLLVHFEPDADAKTYVARALLRRLVDPALVGAVNRVMFGASVDWADVDRQVALALDLDGQILLVHQALAVAPGDPDGEMRLLRLLGRAGRLDDAITRGGRLRDQGLMTPLLAKQLGEVLVRNGRPEEAKRVFSEIVEFDPQGERSRRLLGDIFLRHGWHDDAYRQYEELVRLAPEDATAAIRVARAGAGAGRIDEGLRRLRKVAAGEGRPGADDPRRWARLHGAALLAGVLESGDAPRDQVTRELRRLQLFDTPMTWTLLVWNDLSASLRLVPPEGQADPGQADAIDAGTTGLVAIPRPVADWTVAHRGLPPDAPTAYTLVTLRWTGTAFEVERKPGIVAPAGA